MYMRYILLLLLAVAIIAGCNSEDKKEQPPTAKPNFVFLFADDFTFDAVRAYGNGIVHTPNLDRLAQAGVTFTNAYNMGGWHGAICVASRSMIMSGVSLWPARKVEQSWIESDGQRVDQCWGKLLEANGYDTYMTGKWHIRAAADKAFKFTKDVRPGGMPKDYWVGNDTIGKLIADTYNMGGDLGKVLPLGYNRPKSNSDTLWSAADPTNGGYWEGGTHWSEVVKNNALEFIQQASAKENPFFMYLAFNAPHDPRQAPQEFLDMYPIDQIPLPPSYLPEYPYKDSIGCTPTLRDEALAPFPRTEFAIKTHIREYYAIISHLDQQIGEIIDALEASGNIENTYIFFTGDHGLSVGRHGLVGKQSLFDHSIRVPLMMTGPKIPANTKLNADVYLQDIMPTTLQLAGVDKPSQVFFNSFLDLAQGKQKESNYPAIYGAYVNFQRMIRKDGFKLVVYPKIDKLLLFDLEEDPNEINDLSNDPEYTDRLQILFNDLIALQREMEDPLVLNSSRLMD
ncbi:MAG: choline-sulfatase [Cyclobacteriaceae bacterium]|nr:MAG: choline-sulfatase [Cyclobacteriaceae bacterium]